MFRAFAATSMGVMEISREYLSGSSGMDVARAAIPAGPRSLPTGVVTFLLSDVEGSTRLWEGDEEEMGAAIARHYDLLDCAIVLHGGVRPVEQGEGDSVVGAFARPSDALAAALSAQRAFAEERWAQGRELRIRIALHTGEAQLRGQDYYVGRAVIRCARLRGAAHGGQTVLSSATHDLIADRLPDQVTLRDLGSHRLKDLGAPERVWQLCHGDLPEDFPPLRSLDAVANNLPAQLSSFIGRDTELAELRATLESARLVTLTGAGGCGKTRLAVHACAEVADRQVDGVRWVELGAVSDPELVPLLVARTFGLREEEGRPVLDTLAQHLAGVHALLALDNCEHLVGACAELVELLLRAAPRMCVLATSREPLGVPGEVTWRVPSLDDEAATRLFTERAVQARPGFAPDGAETDVITAICRRLDGIPLAIELAAARTRMMPPARIAAALDDRFRLLTGGARTAMPRQQTLETSVAWSHDLLEENERALLRRLSVFAGGFTLDGAENVCAGEPLDRYAVLDLLSRLVDKSLVYVEHPADGRYRLLETIRLYARDRLMETGESNAIRDRHLAFYLGLAEQAEPEIVRADGPRWLARLEREHDNLRSAMEWADATGARETFLRLATALTLFFELHSHLAAGGRWFARALATDDGPSVTRARALWGAAHVALYCDDYETLVRRAPEAWEMAELVGDAWALGRALNINGLAQAFSEPEAARAVLRRSIELGRKGGDDWAVVDGWKMMTVAWIMQDDYDGLAPDLAEFLADSQRLGNRFFIAWYYITVGWVGAFRGDFAAARRSLEIAAEFDHELGGAATAGFATAFLGKIESHTGEFDVAEQRLRRFIERAVATGDGLGAPFALPELARLCIGRGAPAEARALLEPSLEMLRGLPWLYSGALTMLGLAHLTEGDDAAAEAALEEAKTVGGSLDNHRLVASADHHLGLLARRRGQLGTAENLHHEALARQARLGLLPGVVDSLEALAALASDTESFAEAARLHGAASALRTGIALARWPAELAGHEAEVARAADGLGAVAFAEAWAAGEGLTMNEAVAYASRARGERKRPSTGWGSLTPTELEVVHLTTLGLTNPQIAERLFIGRGTVKTHLAHVFVKVGVATRSELAAEATRRGP
jgi:predicted ATPase/class 3 adenylate cyclase/DNA-binding CsgD family transcriptional regulator